MSANERILKELTNAYRSIVSEAGVKTPSYTDQREPPGLLQKDVRIGLNRSADHEYISSSAVDQVVVLMNEVTDRIKQFFRLYKNDIIWVEDVTPVTVRDSLDECTLTVNLVIKARMNIVQEDGTIIREIR